MNPSSNLNNEISRLRKRVRLLLCERWGLFGASVGALAAAVMVGLSTRYEVLLNYWLWAGVVCFGALVGVGAALLKRLSDLTIATAADRRTGLKERLSTAVAVDSSHGEMAEAVKSDAGSHVARLRSAEVFKHRFGRPHWTAGASFAVLLAVIFVPQIPALQSKVRQQEVVVMKTEGQKLVKLAKDMKKIDTEHKELKKLADKLQELGQKMETGRMSRKDAMLKTQKLASEIKKEQDRLAKENSSSKSLKQAQADMRKASTSLAQKVAQQMAKKENIPPEEALKKVPSDEQLAKLARKDGPLTASERKELEEAISKYADKSSSASIPSELGEALAKLAQNGDFQKAAELMQKLAQKMNSGNMGEMDQKMLQQQMDALAEALKNTDLDKLAKQMADQAQKLSQMSPEELQKMMDEMQKAQQMAKALEQAGGG